MKVEYETIRVIKIDDIVLANLFGMCDGEEIFLEGDMQDFINEEIADGNIDEDDEDILELQSIIRKELETCSKVKIEYLR